VLFRSDPDHALRVFGARRAEPPGPHPAVSHAHVISTDAKALAVATSVARLVAHGAAERDAQRTVPFEQLEVVSGSGLLGITVPRVHGGADVTATTLLEVFRRLAVADPNVAQIPQSHVVYLSVLRRHGTPEQRRFFFAEALAGKRFANAQAEPGAAHPLEIRTRLAADSGAGTGFRLRGVQGYTTGALFAHWLGVPARDEQDRLQVAYVPADAPGVTVLDDWAGMGQRTTASGTVKLDDVWVPAEHVVPHHRTFEAPQLYPALARRCTRRSMRASPKPHSSTRWSSSAPAAGRGPTPEWTPRWTTRSPRSGWVS